MFRRLRHVCVRYLYNHRQTLLVIVIVMALYSMSTGILYYTPSQTRGDVDKQDGDNFYVIRNVTPLVLYHDVNDNNVQSNNVIDNGVNVDNATNITEHVIQRVLLDGEINARYAQELCKDYPSKPFLPSEYITIRWNKPKTIMYCPTYKIGTTFLRRVYMIESSMAHAHLINPYEIAFDKDFEATRFTPTGPIDAYTYMFVREPFGRLLSFYVDKLMATNTYYWKVVGVHAIKGRPASSGRNSKCGDDVTFPEFIRYAIKTLVSGKDVDPHWVEMNKNCRSCDIRYDFIGKMENFGHDSDDILIKLGMKKTAEFMRENGAREADMDAIRDSVSQPYTFRSKYRHCLTFQEAVQRAWLKLQIRGIVGPGPAPTNLTATNSKSVDLFNLALASRDSTPKSERKLLKQTLQNQYWAQIDLHELLEIKRLYGKDFKLFNYDDHPEFVFQGRTLNETLVQKSETLQR